MTIIITVTSAMTIMIIMIIINSISFIIILWNPRAGPQLPQPRGRSAGSTDGEAFASASSGGSQAPSSSPPPRSRSQGGDGECAPRYPPTARAGEQTRRQASAPARRHANQARTSSPKWNRGPGCHP